MLTVYRPFHMKKQTDGKTEEERKKETYESTEKQMEEHELGLAEKQKELEVACLIDQVGAFLAHSFSFFFFLFLESF